MWSKVLNDISLSVGALLTALIAFSGRNYIDAKLKQRDNELMRLRRAYPRSKLGTDFKLIRTSDSDKVYLLESKVHKNIRHWIENETTLKSLSFSFEDVEYLTQEELIKYPEGESYNTKL